MKEVAVSPNDVFRRHTRFTVRWLVVPLIALAAAGCCKCPPIIVCPDCSAKDPAALLVTIDADRHTSPPDNEVIIRRSTGQGIQWYNDGDAAVKVTLGGSVAYELAPKSYSVTYYLSDTKEFPPGSGADYYESIPYEIIPPAEGPPDPPSFGVGP